MEMLDYILENAEKLAADMNYEKYIEKAAETNDKRVYGSMGIETLYDGFKNIEYVKLEYVDIAEDYFIGYHGRAEAKIYAALTTEFKRLVCRAMNNDTLTPTTTLKRIITAFAYEILRRKIIFSAVQLGYMDETL